MSSAYYAPLIAAWNSTIQPPSSAITGVGLTSTMTTAQKLGFFDSWFFTGVIPASLNVSGAQLANCTVYSEFTALSSAQQAQWLALCAIGGSASLLLGGSTNTTLLTDGMAIAFFSSTTTTRANFTNLAQAAQTPWWQQNGYGSPISLTDLSMAGLS